MSSHVLNLSDVLRTLDPDYGLWSTQFESEDLAIRTAKYFTANPHLLCLILTSTHLIAPQGSPSTPHMSLPNVTMIIAFWRQRYGDKTCYWVDPVTLQRTPRFTRVLDTSRLTSEVKRVLRPYLDIDKITFSPSSSSTSTTASSSSSSCSSSSTSGSTASAPSLILSCAHGVMDMKTKDAWSRLGFDPNSAVVDVRVTEAKEDDPEITNKVVSIANTFYQRAVFDKPADGRFHELIYHGDVYSGIQLAVPAILDGLGWLKTTKIAAMCKGTFVIVDPFENTDFDLMMSAYHAYMATL